jgi:hypothetical protein
MTTIQQWFERSRFDTDCETLEEYAQKVHKRLQMSYPNMPKYNSIEDTETLVKEHME